MANHIGPYLFLAGILLAVILGIVSGAWPTLLDPFSGIILLIFIILGLVFGLVNIKAEHRSEFLVAVIAIVVVGVITVQQSTSILVGDAAAQQSVTLASSVANLLNSVFQNIVAFSAPAALVVGLRQIAHLGYGKSKK
ncbi:MAG: hypothetical protein WCW13_07170 [archaeon]|jgi:hypothetical protein